MKKIPLTQGQIALVDDTDYDWLNQWKWCAVKKKDGSFYAIRGFFHKENNQPYNYKRYHIIMAREILNLKFGDKRQADHRNHNRLDNTRKNLRISTCQQNNRNRKACLNSTSRFKGVFWNKHSKKWVASIKIKGKTKYLGGFKEEVEAASAYNKAAKKYYGKFAYLNRI